MICSLGCNNICVQIEVMAIFQDNQGLQKPILNIDMRSH